MSLVDTDKNQLDRSSPQPNHSDRLNDGSIKAHATTSVHPVTDATTTSGYLQTKNGRILGNDGTNNIGLFGFDDAGNMVVKVAKSGYDANSATNDQLVFNSNQNVFKIALSGTVSLAITSPLTNTSRSTVTVAHGLSYAPAVIGYLSGNGNATYLATGTYYQLPYVDGFGGLSFSFTVDSTNVTFYCYNNSGGSISGLGTVVFKYYILQETAN